MLCIVKRGVQVFESYSKESDRVRATVSGRVRAYDLVCYREELHCCDGVVSMCVVS